jgi:pimeloyl-ACP methyl ester carboxylesterase
MPNHSRWSLIQEAEPVSVPLWREAFTGIDIARLRVSPVYYGVGVERGNGSAVVTVPGFMGSDLYLSEFRFWLRRIGYRPYASRIGRNVNCLQKSGEKLLVVLERAHRQTGRGVHLVGHSLGGLICRSVASLRPELVASVTTLGSPIRAINAHPAVIEMSDLVRDTIQLRHTESEMNADCFSGKCECPVVQMAREPNLQDVPVLSIYTKTDGVVHWSVCIDEDAEANVEVQGTHCGLAFNPDAFRHLSRFLHMTSEAKPKRRSRRTRTGVRIANSAETGDGDSKATA